MATKRQKIQIQVEATTEGAVRGMERVAAATSKARKAGEKHNSVLEATKREYAHQQTRVKNAEANVKAFAAAEQQATAAARAHERAIAKQARGYRGLSGAVSGAADRIRVDAVGALRSLVDMGGAAINTTVELAHESLALTNVFNNLPFSLNSARRATRGLADDTTLARNAIMAHQSGVATTAQSYGELVGMAQTLALKMGRDVNETVERVTQGLAKQERELLDELVILPRMEDMWGRLADQLGTTTAQLTDHQKNAVFTKEALEAMRAATQGVELDMDGAAGAIVRTTVQAKNLRAALLGAEEKHITLADGVAQLDSAILRNLEDIDVYRGTFYEIEDALLQTGVATEKYRNNAKALERDIRKVIAAETDHLVKLGMRKELTEDQVGAIERLIEVNDEMSEIDRKILDRERERLGINIEAREAEKALNEELQTGRREALDLLEQDIAFYQAAQADQGFLNELVQEEAELRALVLETEGKLTEAAKIRRRAEIDAAKAAGAEIAPRRGRGGRSRRSKDLARQNAAIKVQNEQQARIHELNEARAGAALAERAARNPFNRALAEQQMAEVVDLEERRAQLVLQARLREVEQLRANGVDRVTVAQRETEAHLAAIDVQVEATDRRFQREIDLALLQGRHADEEVLQQERAISLAELQDNAEAQHHAVAMARLEERMRKEEEAAKRKQQLLDLSAKALEDSAIAIGLAAINEGASISHGLANVALGIAKQHGLLALSEASKATVAALSGNIPLAAAHAASAAQSTAVALAAAAVGGGLVGLGGANARTKQAAPGGFGAGDFGGGATQPGAGAQSQSQSRSSSGFGGEVPISAESRMRVAEGAAAPPIRAGMSVVVHMGGVHVAGLPSAQTAIDMEKAATAAGRRVGRMAVGGEG